MFPYERWDVELEKARNRYNGPHVGFLVVTDDSKSGMDGLSAMGALFYWAKIALPPPPSEQAPPQSQPRAIVPSNAPSSFVFCSVVVTGM
jgi:hypothetical protein